MTAAGGPSAKLTAPAASVAAATPLTKRPSSGAGRSRRALRAALGDVELDAAAGEVEQGIAGDGLAGGAVEVDGVAADRGGGVDDDAHDLAVARALTGHEDRQDEGAVDGGVGRAGGGVEGEDPGAGAGAGRIVGDDAGGEVDADVGQGLGRDGDQAVALEAEAELAAEHGPTGVALDEAEAAHAGVEVVADELEVRDAAAGGEQGEVVGEELAGGPERGGAGLDAAGDGDAGAPDPQGDAGVAIPQGVDGAELRGEAGVGP